MQPTNQTPSSAPPSLPNNAGEFALPPEEPKKLTARDGCFGCLGLIICALFVAALFGKCSGDKTEQTDPEFTSLGEKAMKLKSSHTRIDVLKRLGKPDWIIVPSDSPSNELWKLQPGSSMMFIYKNPGGRVIRIDFSQGRFSGADAGMDFGGFADEVPPDEYSSKRPDRSEWANVLFLNLEP